MKKKINKINRFFSTDIWTYNESELSFFKLRIIRFLQFLALAFAGFRQDKLNLRASALTYFTMLSIVPLLALGFGIAKGFGLEAVLERELANSLSAQKEALEYILNFVRSMLATAKGGLIAGVGLVMLLWSVMKLMGNIETAFNKVWDVKSTRSWLRKSTDYLTIIIIGTVLMILSGSISIFISTELQTIAEGSEISAFSPLVLHFGRILPYLISWFLFTTMYIVMPNTSVKFKPALIAGFIVTIVFHLFQYAYVSSQTYATRINAIYGSFAALPLFLIWLQTTWFLLLLGVEISFAIQNLRLKGEAFEHKRLSLYYEKQLALWLIKIVIDRFEEGKKAYTLIELSAITESPTYSIEAILKKLQKAELISITTSDNDETRFQPAQSSNNIDIHKVIKKYEILGEDLGEKIKNPMFKKLRNNMDDWYKQQKKSELNALIKDIQV